MNKNTKRALIIKNFSSPYISEAIVFLKDSSCEKEDKIINEAEKIISDYVKGKRFLADMNYSYQPEDISIYKKNTPLANNTKKTHRRRPVVIFSLITTVLLLCVYAIYNNINI